MTAVCNSAPGGVQFLNSTPDMHSANSTSRVDEDFGNVGQTLRQRVRIGVERVRKTRREAQGKSGLETEPPSYTEACPQGRLEGSLFNANVCPTTDTHSSASQYPLLTRIVEEEQTLKSRHLRMYLAAIIAVTFSANLGELDAANTNSNLSIVSQHRQESFSILSKHHWDVLKELCALVRDLEERLRRRRWPTTCQQDKDLLVKCVLEPTRGIRIQKEYILEMLGRFRIVEAHGVKEIKTLVDHWTPSNTRILPRWTSPMLDLGDTLASHAYFIASLHLEKEEALVLDRAMAKYRKDQGLEDIRNSKGFRKEMIRSGQLGGWPLSDGYVNLAKALRTRAMRRDDWHSWLRLERLRHHRKYGWYFPFLL
ncbi:hypothetical protein BDV96DRAFT_631637 [Lophiotrema nucula]|uniref:Uncharacterized protein n=1 Tax=Lophiotrema nucula TaxID=690887 RepID=A0A6A5ZBF6_9PLEO|nr:hypothetical protein BDV96DRAFT_631637 [Lophiotrema nucula]